jgi:hypothetical protein
MAWFIPRSLSDTNLFTQTDGLTGASSGVWTMPSKSIDCLIASYVIIGKMYLLHKDSDFTEIAKEFKLKVVTE